MKTYQIGKNEAGQRLDKYLHKLLPGASSGFLYKMLRKKNIVCNQKKSSGSEHLACGDEVTLYLSDETIAKFSAKDQENIDPANINPAKAKENAHMADFIRQVKALDILYEDDDLLIINKPAGMLSQKARPQDISANELIIKYLLYKKSITPKELRTFSPSVCNRLDRNTSGILLAGKTLHGLQMMSAQLKERSVSKYYQCLAEGQLNQPQHLKGFLSKDAKKNQVVITDVETKESQWIETAYRPLRVFEHYTWLEIHLITGRSHQIRAHLASIGNPIVGDVKYGARKKGSQLCMQAQIKRQLLHACRIVLKDGMEIKAPLPADFQRALRILEDEKRI